ncbi:MAG: GNAT family N-acetyltransferase [Lachnospiraceae bacterium]|nr:GNAT family N-acetyltransferase [Lachnospiraceae bacterium]
MNFEYIELTNDELLNSYIDEILAIQDACNGSLPEDSWYIPSDKEEFYDYINRQNGIVLVATCGRRVAGVMSAGRDDDHYEQAERGGAVLPSRKYLYLSLVCVDDQFRGNGLQHELMTRTMEIARTKGYIGCWCRVHPENNYSVRNIEKAGMDHTSDYITEQGWPRRIYTCKL